MAAITAGDAEEGNPGVEEDAKLVRAEVVEEGDSHDGNCGHKRPRDEQPVDKSG